MNLGDAPILNIRLNTIIEYGTELREDFLSRLKMS